MTYIYEELSRYDIASRLMQDDNADWTREQALILAEILIETAEQREKPESLCLADVRCQYSAYPSAFNAVEETVDQDTVQSIVKNATDEYTGEIDEDEREIFAYQYLHDNGTLVGECRDGSVLIEN